MNEIKNKQILNDAKDIVRNGNLKDYVEVIEKNYSKEDYLKIVAGLLKMMREK